MTARPITTGFIGGLFAVLVSAAPALAVTTTVSESSGGWTNSWTVYNRANGNVSLSTEFGAPTDYGKSVLKLVTTNDTERAGDSKTGLTTDKYAGMQLSAITNISYYAYRDDASTANPVQYPALNVEIDVNGADAGGSTTLVYEPEYNKSQQTPTTDTWQLWNAGDETIWWSSNAIPGAPNRDTFVTLTEIKEQNPQAVVGKVGVNQGGGNAGLTGAVDGLSVNDDTYNFEAPVTLSNKDQCKNDGWKTSTNPTFKNQGECVSKFASQDKKQHNRPANNPADQIVDFFRSLF